MIYLNKIQVYCGPNGKIGKQNLFNHKYSSLVKPLNPYWVTGFCNRSASFIIIPSFRKSNQKWEIKATFEILVDSKYSEILERIQFFFGIGKTYKIGTKAYYRVTKISDLTNIIIPHFKSFPLLSGQKVEENADLKAMLERERERLAAEGYNLHRTLSVDGSARSRERSDRGSILSRQTTHHERDEDVY